MAPEPLDVLSNDEPLDMVSDEEVASSNETIADREAREKRNKFRLEHKRCAQQRRASQGRYECELDAYNREVQRRRLAQEADDQ